MGNIYENDSANTPIDDKRYYCAVCLDEQKKCKTFHLSIVANFSVATNTGNINKHLLDSHDTVVASSESGVPKILDYIAKHGSEYAAFHIKCRQSA